MGNEKRLDPSVFDFPVQEFRRGYRSAIYFWRSKRILEDDNHHPKVTIQVFLKKSAVLCGIDEAVGILKCAAGYFKDYPQVYKLFDRYLVIKQEIRKHIFHANYERYLELNKERMDISDKMDDLWVSGFNDIEVNALYDGDCIEPQETIMTVDGDYSLFAHLESLYLGVLARRTRVATNTRRVVEAARGKPVLFFADRFDHFATQGGDGYATHIGGATGVATDAMARWYGERGLGTMPHAFIACYNGDTVLATKKFHEYLPHVKSISLVDFRNNCVEEALKSARELKDELFGVRLDNSEDMVDYSLNDLKEKGVEGLNGVVPALVFRVREALDKEGFNHVQIIVSGGFNPDKITRFEQVKAPVDMYAVGSWMLSGNYDYTADIVRVNGRKLSKTGREYRPNKRLEKVY